jgi:hypothetical protein
MLKMTNLEEMESKELLVRILEELGHISTSLKTITSLLNGNMTQEIQNDSEIKPPSMPSSLEILELQESRPGIFRTYKAIQKKDDWVKSTDIANETKRSRGLESRYLNYLSKKGFVLKKREKTDPDSRATEVWYKIVGVNG